MEQMDYQHMKRLSLKLGVQMVCNLCQFSERNKGKNNASFRMTIQFQFDLPIEHCFIFFPILTFQFIGVIDFFVHF